MKQTVSQLAKSLEAQMKVAPGRKQELPLFQSFAPTFKSMTEQLERIIETQDEPIKVVLMGEVKSGKSTLINSMLRQCISGMDVSEATALIHQFTYSEVPYGKVIYKNGKVEKGSVQNIQDKIAHQLQKAEARSEIRCVEFGLNIPLLKRFMLVDTPGIGTVTTVNEELTKYYIQEADIILWIFNSKYIGQSNIKEEVIQVIDMGKEVIGVLNRIDEIQMEEDKLIEAAEEYISYIDYMTVSAYNALESILDGNMKSHGVLEILEAVDSYIGAEKRQTKEKLIAGQLNTLVDKEISLHEQLLKLTYNLMKQGEAQRDKIDDLHELISKKINIRYLKWLDESLFVKQLEKLEEIKDNKQSLLAWQARYLNETWLNGYIQKEWEILTQQIEIYWRKGAEELDKGLVNQIKEILGVEEYTKEIEEEEQIGIDRAAEKEEAKKTLLDEVAGGIGIGAILSGIVLGIGPVAAQVSFFTVAVPIIPTVVGGMLILKYFQGKRVQELQQLECAELYKNLKESAKQIREEVIEGAYKEERFTLLSEEMAQHLKGVLDQKLCVRDTTYLEALENEVGQYKEELQYLKKQLKDVAEENDNIKVAIEEAECLEDLLG